ncbi:MAG: GTP cyclohydrolase II [Pseudomonadota bacterium]
MQTVPLALEHFRRGGVVLLSDQAGAGHLVVAAHRASVDAVDVMVQAGTGAFHLAVTAGDFDRPDGAALIPALPEFQTMVASVDGLLQREGLAEAAVDLARLSGHYPHTLLRSVVRQNLKALAKRHGLPILTVAALAHHRRRYETMLDFVAVADLPTAYSEQPFRAHSFRSRLDGVEHLALVSPGTAVGAPLVRIHSECLTGDAFGSLRCDCGPQLQESLRRLAATPGGILVYMRGHEGRGIGLANKMRAYALQDQGMDTVEANRALGLPDDARDFAQAAQILRALGHQNVRLLSNNPEKAASLKRHGIWVAQVEPLIMPPNPFNARYLDTKAVKFGHALPMPRTMAN